jgi:hypothetical protein
VTGGGPWVEVRVSVEGFVAGGLEEVKGVATRWVVKWGELNRAGRRGSGGLRRRYRR